MTKTDWTAEEVRALAKYLAEGTPNWFRESFGDYKSSVHTLDNAPKNAVAILTAYAERIEVDERAVPVATTCAKEVDDNSVSFCLLDWIALSALPAGTDLFTHPPTREVQSR
jgi:hypothetical protein